MHAILASLGTDGDILPFLGLATTLRGRGHRVTFLAAEHYEELAGAHQLEFRQLVSSETMRQLLGHPDVWHPIKAGRYAAKIASGMIEPQYRLIRSLADDPESLLITNPAVFGAAIVNETLRRPLAHLILQPWLIHSPCAPALMPIPGLPRWAPRVFHSLFYYAIDVVGDLFVGPTLNRLRRSVGLKPIRRLFHNWLSRDLLIGMFPEWYGPPQLDWPPQIRLAGFPRFDGAIDRSPPPGLPEFLRSQKPTILFTFGSGMMHARLLFEVAARVCSAVDCQGLFVSRHFKPEPLPPRMFHADFIPFRDIFPRCDAVVHHGGIGTTAEALTCGTPQLILPLGFDQLDNGDRIQRLGAGLHTQSKHRLITNTTVTDRDVAEIAAAVRKLLTPGFREGAQALSLRLKQENALETAAGFVEELARCASDRPRL